MKHACCFDSQNHAAITWSRALSRCDMTTCGMRASTNQGTDKREKSRMHTESKIQGNNNASRRGQTNIASRRGQKDTLAETGQHYLSQRWEHCHSQRQNNVASSQRREEKQGKNKLLFPHRGTRDTFELIHICWTLNTKRREQGCLSPKRQTLPRVSRLHSVSL